MPRLGCQAPINSRYLGSYQNIRIQEDAEEGPSIYQSEHHNRNGTHNPRVPLRGRPYSLRGPIAPLSNWFGSSPTARATVATISSVTFALPISIREMYCVRTPARSASFAWDNSILLRAPRTFSPNLTLRSPLIRRTNSRSTTRTIRVIVSNVILLWPRSILAMLDCAIPLNAATSC